MTCVAKKGRLKVLVSRWLSLNLIIPREMVSFERIQRRQPLNAPDNLSLDDLGLCQPRNLQSILTEPILTIVSKAENDEYFPVSADARA